MADLDLPIIPDHYREVLESVRVSDLRPHPRNYRTHPKDQVDHLIESIREHGFYRNIVIARDGTILAGHGVVQAAQKMGLDYIPVIRLDIDKDDPRALKVLTGDNEIAHLGEIDDRALSELLKEIKDYDITGLRGTGYDEKMLANLVFVTRPQSEVEDFNAAAEWVGMPEYTFEEQPLKITVSFRNEKDRNEFGRLLGITMTEKTKAAWWPPKEREDPASLKFQG